MHLIAHAKTVARDTYQNCGSAVPCIIIFRRALSIWGHANASTHGAPCPPVSGGLLTPGKPTLGCTIGARRQRRAQKAAPLRRRFVYPYIELFSSPLHALAAANKVLAAALRSILHRGMPELRGRGTSVISRVLRMLNLSPMLITGSPPVWVPTRPTTRPFNSTVCRHTYAVNPLYFLYLAGIDLPSITLKVFV